MRVHISLDDALVAELDAVVGERRRSAFIAEAVRRALDDARRRQLFETAVGSVADDPEQAWGDDPAAWVHTQRHGDGARVG